MSELRKALEAQGIAAHGGRLDLLGSSYGAILSGLDPEETAEQLALRVARVVVEQRLNALTAEHIYHHHYALNDARERLWRLSEDEPITEDDHHDAYSKLLLALLFPEGGPP